MHSLKWSVPDAAPYPDLKLGVTKMIFPSQIYWIEWDCVLKAVDDFQRINNTRPIYFL